MKRAALAVLLLWGCGKEPVGLRLLVRVASDERVDPLARPGSPVETLALRAWQAGGAEVVSASVPNDFAVSARLDLGALKIAPGPGWTVSLSGIDREGALYSLGRTAPFEVPGHGEVTPPLVLGLADDFAPSGVVPGGLGPFATANVLPDGSVLLLGLGGVKRFTPSTGALCSQSCFSGQAPAARFHHTALQTTQGVVILGGLDALGQSLQDGYVLSADGTFSTLTLAGPPLPAAAAAALLSSGQILLAGGKTASGVSDQVLLVDVGAGSVAAGPPLPEGVWLAEATALRDGRVLISGGYDASGVGSRQAVLVSADGASRSALAMGQGRAVHSATLLPDGAVLVFGGRESLTGFSLAAPEVFSVDATAFLPVVVTGPMAAARAGQVGLRLPSGEVLLVGGESDGPGPVDPGRTVPGARFHADGALGGSFQGSFSEVGQSPVRSTGAWVGLADSSVLLVGGTQRELGADPARAPPTAEWVQSVQVFTPCRLDGSSCAP